MVTVALFKTMFEDCGLKSLNSCLKASVIFLGVIFFCLCLFYIALVHGQGESDLPAGPAAGTLQVPYCILFCLELFRSFKTRSSYQS